MNVSNDLLKKRERFREQIHTALEEDPDPLSAYDNFIKWTLEHYPKQHLAQSGLLELLEEATRQFKDDPAYKGDLRYLKLWSLYASHVEDPTVIYAHLLSNNIGMVYAQMYWEYALALECAGRRAEAEAVYKQGIQRRARPVDPLKRRYEEFKNRATPPTSIASTNATYWKAAPSSTRALRRNPLKYHASDSPSVSTSTSVDPQSTSSARPTSQTSSDEQKRERYALMLAPPVPGKRPEKLRFNLSLLFTEDGTEYSMQEARARSMGLLGKKWGPPPEAAAVRVNFKDGPSTNGTRTGGMTRTMRKGFEPTVTLATKEALADVFGMYNSPEKSMRFGAVAGSKHAPVHKVAPVTPMSLESQFRSVSNENALAAAKTPKSNENAMMPVKTPKANENAGVPAKTPVWRPFVDENAESITPAPPPKSKSFDEQPPSKLPTFTPNPGRRALSIKDASTPAQPAKDDLSQSTKTPGAFKPAPVFSAVFTPVADAPTDRPAARRDTGPEQQPPSRTASTSPAEAASVFTPFRDPEPPMKVFSRPPTRNENASASESAPALQSSTFKIHVDNDEDAAPVPPRQAFSERAPLRAAFVAPAVDEPEDEATQQTLEDSYEEDDEEYDEGVPEDAPLVPAPLSGEEGEDDSMFEDGEDLASRPTPLGGRFGKFDVLTPIAERTLEYATSTRSTPNDTTDSRPTHQDPVEIAEQLAAELREEEEAEERDKANGLTDIEERTGTLSLTDALAVASSFQPPNPCNPFDPPIVKTLLSLIPPDHDFHDLRQQDSGRLEAIQKFAKKKSRRNSGNTTGKVTEEVDTLEVDLLDHRFGIQGKLGEGGFGAVFEAVDLDMQEELDEADDVDLDAEEKAHVALKVVKPRNLWEFHVLRRIHRTVHSKLRDSIITPQALYAFRDESFLVLELRRQGTLLDVVNRAAQNGMTQQGGCLDELLVMFFAIELMRILEGLHRAGFIHGDVKIDNCLLRLEEGPEGPATWSSIYQPSGEGDWCLKGIKLIDFGRTIDTRLFPAGQQYIAEWPTDARDCLEMREGRPWTFQTDYFGLAGIIYCMLYGKYIEASSVTLVPGMENRYKLATPMKRYWQVDLWTRVFDLLLNPCLVRDDGQLPVCDELAELRVEMEVWLQASCNRASNTLKGLLKKLNVVAMGGAK